MAQHFDQKAMVEEALKKGAYIVGYGPKEVGGKLTDEMAIKFAVPKKLSVSQIMATAFAKSYDGIPSDVYESEMPRSLEVMPALEISDRFRPVPGGCSVSHANTTAGTLGCWVNYNGRKAMLSNNHVLANSNDASIGDDILQPGTHDGGEYPQDHIANLTKFERIKFIGEESNCKFSRSVVKGLNMAWSVAPNKPLTRFAAPIVAQAEYNNIDAAIAEPFEFDYIDDTVLGIGKPTGIKSGELNIPVQKMGRTTEHTLGLITQIDVTAQVGYGGSRVALFEDQLIVTSGQPFSAGGDSGSVVLDMECRLVGLLFAGSDTVTIVNRIENVFETIGVSL